MAIATVSGVRLAGLASAVPETTATVDNVAQIFGEDTAQKIAKNTGVMKRHISSSEMCTSDLCEAAARRLLSDLDWKPDSVDLLVFVSQTSDYRLPATSCVLHGKLGMAKSCAALDVNLGCSGYVYGLWLAGQMMQAGNINRALLLVGDTISRTVAVEDRSAAPLFGDAGTATALEINVNAEPMFFELGTDGTGAESLIIPAGGFRQPSNELTARLMEHEGGNVRSDEHLYMNGADIFAFTLREVPAMLNAVLQQTQWHVDDVDAFVLHQANRFILKHLAKRMKLPTEKVPYTIEEFGNTSSASVPITMTEKLGASLREKQLRLILAGFGVGLSWAAAALTCGPIIISELVKVPIPYAHITDHS